MTRTPKMERRHFEFIAETIRFAHVTPEVRRQMAAEFAGALKQTNGRFEVARFLEAATKPRADDLAIAAE